MHWTSIRTQTTVAWKKRLHTGEFVSFTPSDAPSTSGSRQAVNITGVGGEMLLVEHGNIKYLQYTRVGLPVVPVAVPVGGSGEQNTGVGSQIHEA